MVVASYVKSKGNIAADTISKKPRDNLEQSPCNSAFEELIAVFGLREIDFFASRINYKIKKFVTDSLDLNAFADGAFSVT